MLLTLLACTCLDRVPDDPPATVAARVDPVPLFVRPFREDHGVTNFFDHGDGERVVKTDGAPTWGIHRHLAYDFGMKIGTELFAMADGVVLKAGDLGPKRCTGGSRAPDNVQLWVLHDGPDGQAYVSQLRHLSEVLVAKGDHVLAGQLVARSGNTGCSSGPHLHLEVTRVTNRRTGAGVPIDPYGWSGDGPDPRAQPSPWMWREGQAPALRRSASGLDRRAAFGPRKIVAVDALDPVGGEWVELGVRRDTPHGLPLAGLSLRNDRGESFPLPDRTIPPGGTLRVYTRKAAPGPDEVSWDRDTPAWDDAGDCAALVDSRGEVLAALPFGRGPGRCKGFGGPVEEPPIEPDE